MMAGVLLVAVLVLLVGTDRLVAWAARPGRRARGARRWRRRVNPNFTLALAEVPPHMGGAAGAAMQTGQRIGSAIGAALLMTVYEVVQGSGSTSRGLQAALLTALVVAGRGTGDGGPGVARTETVSRPAQCGRRTVTGPEPISPEPISP